MKDQKRNINSHSWLIWGLAAACFAVGWAILTGWPVAQSGSQAIEQPVTKPALEQELPADGLLDNLQPVQEWFEENVPEGREAIQPYTEYVRVSDDTDTISFQAPREWNDIDIVQWKENGSPVGHYLAASADLAGFESGEEAGISMRVYAPKEVVFSFGDERAKGTLLNDILANEQNKLATNCHSQGQYDLKNNFYDAEYEFFSACGRAKQQVLTIRATPRHRAYVILLNIVVTNQADVDAAAHILQSFQVLGEAPDFDFDPHHEH